MSRRFKRRATRWPWFLLLLLAIGGGYLAYDPTARQAAKDRWEVVRSTFSEETPAPPPPAEKPSPPVQDSSETQPRVESTVSRSFAGPLTFAGEPKVANYPNRLTLLRNTAFLVAYDETRRNPAWVAYRIPAQRLTEKFSRPSRFTIDPRPSVHVTHDDYTRSGFDRGHMAPNYAIASRFGKTAQDETFLMTNVVPQKPALNQGPWRLLEETLAEHAAVNFGEVWVVVGPIYDAKVEKLTSGPEIPDAFFCVVADETPAGPRLQAFILPQDTPRTANFRDYVKTVDAAELEAGLDFFSDLPDPQEAQLEDTGAYWLE